MIIAICGSMVFAQEMLDVKSTLEKNGHKVVLPHGCKDYLGDKHKERVKVGWRSSVEGVDRKIENDLIRKHFKVIDKSDAVLVINLDKKDIKNYIGGNSFLEMGFAHVLNKKIYLYKNIPKEKDTLSYFQEILAMQPVILNGDLSKIK